MEPEEIRKDRNLKALIKGWKQRQLVEGVVRTAMETCCAGKEPG